MPFSHHSHSGQFCGHAQNTLEEMVKRAIEKKMRVFALTEHMPREEDDLYPEEVKLNMNSVGLQKLFDDYYHEAVRLQSVYSGQIEILVGMEVDWIRPSSDLFIRDLLSKYPLELFIGSVHHVHTKPIDYDHEMYAQAREIAGGTDERLFEDYFDLQFSMLNALKPPIVGHFDVIRLKASDPDGSFRRWEGVWQRISRNLDFIADYGGVLELNSAALRKGMLEPYPNAEVCKVFLAKGGRFTLSDDSHGTDQVGTNYDRLLRFVHGLGIQDLARFSRRSTDLDSRSPNIAITMITVNELTEPWSVF